ncbi:MAG: transcriptional repressor [Deltaproteobacteria bacterium]|nr:transcriptional repressor [Deltaproteobacteria bacterium]
MPPPAAPAAPSPRAPLSAADAKELLKVAALRATAPRLAVMQLLAEERRPLSHTEVVQRLGSGEWDQATLYRNLVKLTEVGLARVASEAAGVKRYELRGAPHSPRQLHPHFVCNGCGGVSCLPEVTVAQDPTALLALGAGWREAALAASVHFVGRCPACAG